MPSRYFSRNATAVPPLRTVNSGQRSSQQFNFPSAVPQQRNTLSHMGLRPVLPDDHHQQHHVNNAQPQISHRNSQIGLTRIMTTPPSTPVFDAEESSRFSIDQELLRMSDNLDRMSDDLYRMSDDLDSRLDALFWMADSLMQDLEEQRSSQQFILPSNVPQQRSTPPHLRRIVSPDQRQRHVDAQHQASRGNSLPQQTRTISAPLHLLRRVSLDHHQNHADVRPQTRRGSSLTLETPISTTPSTPVSDAAELSWGSIDHVLEQLEEQLEMSDGYVMEIETHDNSPYGCTPAAENAIFQLLAPVLTPDAELDDCTICMDEMRPKDGHEYQIVKLPCSHIFHGDCIMKWLCNHSTCPICRFQLPDAR